MVEIIDIEDMLIWAYRAQAVDRMAAGIWEALGQKGPASYGLNPFATIAGLGVRVDGGGWRGSTGHAYGHAASAVDDDALALHEAVLALPPMVMEASEVGSIALTWQDRLAAGGIRETADGALCRNGVPVGGEKIEPAILIIAQARSASRPDTVDDFVADFSERPRDSAGRWIADRDSYRRTLDDVIRMRGLYAAWRAGLCRLVEECGGFARHRLVGPGAPEAPWATERRERTILHAIPTVPDKIVKPVRRRRAKTAERRRGQNVDKVLMCR